MNRNIFIVEDDQDIAKNLQELLEDEGYDVEIARDGQAALNRLKSGKSLPSLILLDLMMPIMDGFQFRAAQESDPRLAPIPVIIMTADGHIEAKKQKIGAKAFVRKPVDIDLLLATVQRHTS